MKVLVVTGGSRGIGAAVTRKGAKAGYAVAVNYRSAGDAAEALVTEIAASGGRAVAIQADVAKAEEVARLFAEVDSRLGAVTALVNNAGIIGRRARLDEMSATDLDAIWATNVRSCLLCAGEALKRMSTRHGGRGGTIVNISSAAARTGGIALEVAYAASKGALDSFTIGLAKEVGSEGVRVVGIRPGLIATEIHAAHGGQETLDTLGPTVPIGRVGTVEEVADAALYLLSDAASYIHGAVIDVSGGR